MGSDRTRRWGILKGWTMYSPFLSTSRMLDRADQHLKTFPPIVMICPTCPCCHGRGYLAPKTDAAIVVAAIVDAFGSRMFSLRELRRHTSVDDALGDALSTLSQKRLGKLLSKSWIERKIFDG